MTKNSRIAKAVCLIYWLILFAGTHGPFSGPQTGVSHFDKILHFFAYLVLAVLFSLVRQPRRALEAKVFIPLVFYAAFDEVTQPYVGRSMEFLDWLADLAGILAGSFLFHSLQSKWPRLTR